MRCSWGGTNGDPPTWQSSAVVAGNVGEGASHALGVAGFRREASVLGRVRHRCSQCVTSRPSSSSQCIRLQTRALTA